jgi:hypothetical protein
LDEPREAADSHAAPKLSVGEYAGLRPSALALASAAFAAIACLAVIHRAIFAGFYMRVGLPPAQSRKSRSRQWNRQFW